MNGQLRDANALDLDGLIRSSDRSRYDNGGGHGGSGGSTASAGGGASTGSGSNNNNKSSGRKKSAIDRQREAGIDVVNPNSIHYR